MIKKYGASIAEFMDKLNEKKNSPLKEVKRSTIKQIQDATDNGEVTGRRWFRNTTTSLTYRGITLLWSWRSLTWKGYIERIRR